MKVSTLLFALACTIASASFGQNILNWQELGPANVGGRTRAILIDNRDSTRSTIYAGMVSGGLWKSTDRGNSWHQLLSVYSCAAVSCIAQDANGRIYFGTGEGLAIPDGSSRNSGSVGNGLHFLYGNDQDSIIPSTRPAYLTNTDTWSMINRIAINPTSPMEIFAATSGSQSSSGLQHSTDGGQSWTLIGSSAAPINSLPAGYGAGASDVKYSADGSIVFASIGGTYLGNGQSMVGENLIVSQNGGSSFTFVTNTSFPNSRGRVEIGIAPSDPMTAYISIALNTGGFGGVWRTSDGGSTWTQIGFPNGVLTSVFGGGQGRFNIAIVVSPNNTGLIYLGGGQLYSYSDQVGWTQASTSLGGISDPEWIQENVQTLVFNDKDSNELYIGGDGGIFKSMNASSSFPTPTYTASNRGYNTLQNYSVAADRFGNVVGGAQEGGTYLLDINHGTRQIEGSTGVYAEVSHFDSSVIIAGYVAGEEYRSLDRGISWLGLFDNIIDPQQQGSPTVCGQPYNEAPFITAFWLVETRNATNSVVKVPFVDSVSHSVGDMVTVMSHIGYTFQEALSAPLPAGDTVHFTDRLQSRLYLETYCGLWMTPDILNFSQRPRWFRVTNGYSEIVSLTASATGDTLYLGSGGIVSRITGMNSVNFDVATTGSDSIVMDSSAHYQQLDMTVTSASRYIEGIDVDIHNPNHVLCAVAGFTAPGTAHVYASTDAGSTWTAVQNNLPNMPVYQCVIDAYDSSHYILGSELGFWDSHDAGATWTEQNAGIIVREPVYRLRQQDYLDDQCYALYAGTHGRGMWRCTTLTEAHGCSVTALGIDEPAEGSHADNIWLYPNPMNDQGKVVIQLTEAADVSLQIADMTGRIIRQTVYNNLQAGKNTLDLNTSVLSDGSYVVVARTTHGENYSRTLIIAR